MAPGERKRVLRERFRRARDGLAPETRAAADVAIAKRVRGLPEYREAALVLAYLSFGTEVDTRPVIEAAWSDGKAVACPRCVPGTREMRWHPISSYGGLVRSPLGMLEPAPGASRPWDLRQLGFALALVPGLAFDPCGWRLGYGGGFYDAFLSGFDGPSVGLCREAQVTGEIGEAVDAHDRPTRAIVTELRTIRPPCLP